MEVFVPVSAVVAPPTPLPASTSGELPEGVASGTGAAAPDFAPLLDFLRDHFVRGGYEGGKMMLDVLNGIQSSAEAGKNEFVASLPDVARHLREIPGALGALFSEDPAKIRAMERQFGNLSRDLAAATSAGMLLGLSRFAGTAKIFSVAAGAVVGAAVGGERIATWMLWLREADKED